MTSPPRSAQRFRRRLSTTQFDHYLVHDAPLSMDRESALKVEMTSGTWKLYRRVRDLTEEP
jgi:hypothetical protein